MCSAASAGAQASAPDASSTLGGRRGFELRPFAGALVPTGEQRDLLEDAALVGAQLGWKFHPNLSVTGSFGWTPIKDRTTAFATNGLYTGREETVDAFQYDLGLEARKPMALSTSWTASPYVGLGVGGRTYQYRDVDAAPSETNLIGYGSLGLDIAPNAGPLGIRFEARDNVSGFKGLRGELAERSTRNDVQLTAGLVWRFQAPRSPSRIATRHQRKQRKQESNQTNR